MATYTGKSALWRLSCISEIPRQAIELYMSHVHNTRSLR